MASLGVVGAGGVLDAAFDLLRFRFRRLVALAVVVVVPVRLFDLWTSVAMGTTRSSIDSTSNVRVLDSVGAVGGAAVWVAVAQSFGLFLLGMAVGHLVAGWMQGRDDPFGAVVAAVARRIWVAPVVVVVALVLKMAAACFGGVGFFAVDALLLVAAPVAGAEHLGPFACIGRSLRLSRRAYGVALAVSIGGFMISMLLRIALLLGPSVLVAAMSMPKQVEVLVEQAASLTLLVTLPLTACIAARAYVELRCRVEGLDLRRRARIGELLGEGRRGRG